MTPGRLSSVFPSAAPARRVFTRCQHVQSVRVSDVAGYPDRPSAPEPRRPSAERRAKNVILFLADAGGLPTVNTASLHAQRRGSCTSRACPTSASPILSTASRSVTDSAAGMTAIVTGQKTHNDVIGDPAAATAATGWHAARRPRYAGSAVFPPASSPTIVTDATPAACTPRRTHEPPRSPAGVRTAGRRRQRRGASRARVRRPSPPQGVDEHAGHDEGEVSLLSSLAAVAPDATARWLLLGAAAPVAEAMQVAQRAALPRPPATSSWSSGDVARQQSDARRPRPHGRRWTSAVARAGADGAAVTPCWSSRPTTRSTCGVRGGQPRRAAAGWAARPLRPEAQAEEKRQRRPDPRRCGWTTGTPAKRCWWRRRARGPRSRARLHGEHGHLWRDDGCFRMEALTGGRVIRSSFFVLRSSAKNDEERRTKNEEPFRICN